MGIYLTIRSGYRIFQYQRENTKIGSFDTEDHIVEYKKKQLAIDHYIYQIFYHDMQISRPYSGSPPIRLSDS